MDSIVYGTATAVCKVLVAVDFNQLAFNIGFKSANFLGVPQVYCGAQPSSYKVGVVVLVLAAVGCASTVSAARKPRPTHNRKTTSIQRRQLR